ncbi:hypothetical protein G4V62_06775 [Bacillaceae bacterium SIJ1]|uniref:hypothetical protein n=1 Tax=Litoribacterium kuwaitense TaxID=1398745 RepID=UPI0013ED34C2|nr:hypothetical protein [Litoribacterium kuwaitense]NGP44670.1 hypothetical protein [Litoribacterium kuwaitense]
MRKILFILLMIFISGCEEGKNINTATSSGDNLAKEIIQDDQSADIFVLDDRVYARSEEVKNQDERGERLGVIESNYSKGTKFENGMSTKLPIGTEIYRIKNAESLDQVIVNEGDRLIIYKAQIEG